MQPQPYPIPNDLVASALQRWMNAQELTPGERAVVEMVQASNWAWIRSQVKFPPEGACEVNPSADFQTQLEAEVERAAAAEREREFAQVLAACDGVAGDGRRANAAILAKQEQQHAGSLQATSAPPSKLELLVRAHVDAFEQEVREVRADAEGWRRDLAKAERELLSLRGLLTRALNLTESRHLGNVERQEKIAIHEALRAIETARGSRP